MASLVKNEEVETCLRELLEAEGYRLNRRRAYGQTGVDIIAEKDGELWHIEAIGYKSSGPARAKDFYESFFRIVSRLNDEARHLVIALSDRAEVGLPARAKQHAVAWRRIADAFPELEIWIVKTDGRSYRRTRWLEWLQRA